MINGEQFVIVFNVDDFKLSHRYPNVVSATIAKLELICAIWCKIHNYLGIILDFRNDSIKKLIDSLPEDMIVVKDTATLEHISRTDEK